MNQPVLLTSALVVWSFLLTPGLAQVASDQTLKNESSVVEQLSNQFLIKGGATRGKSLFHSLKDLSIVKSQEVLFSNPNNINLILTRVTGGKPSDINGTLGVSGDADLFLMNPSGIHFGPNASLKLNGSFIATTGDSFVFEDGKEFSARNPQPAPDLKVSVPVGIQFNGNSGKISIKGNSPSSSTRNSHSGLTIKSGNTLSLVGDGVSIIGGKISVESSNIEILSLKNGLISIKDRKSSYQFIPSVNSNFSNIDLRNSSLTVTRKIPEFYSQKVNDINLVGREIFVDSSILQTFTLIDFGNIKIQANDLSLSSSLIKAEGVWNGGDIVFNISNFFFLNDGSKILAISTRGDGGNINITTELLVALRESEIRTDALLGKGGDISISTKGILVSEDSDIFASSSLGIDGLVDIRSPELNNKPPDLTEKPKDIVKGCRPGQSLGNSTFVNVGKGGVPLGPHHIQTPPSIWQDLREPQISSLNSSPSESQEKFIDSKSKASNQASDSVSVPTLIEAQGWVRDNQGRVVLIANASKLVAYNSGQPIANC